MQTGFDCFYYFINTFPANLTVRKKLNGASPLHRIFLKKSREQRARLWAERAREADVFHEDELEQLLVVLVVKRQSAAHHLVHHHA